MSYPHVIRLRGPWQYEVLERDEGCQAPASNVSGQIRLPADWSSALGVGFFGRVRFDRAFNRPSGLSAAERVWLVVAGADAHATVELNGQPLGLVPGYALGLRRDVTGMLQAHNQVTVNVSLQPPSPADQNWPPTERPGREHLPGGLTGGVWLEIHGESSLQGLSVYTQTNGGDAALTVVGRVTGPGLLADLSLLVQGPAGELHFSPLKAGQAFEISVDASSLPAWTPGKANTLAPLEIKLLAGAVCLWQSDLRLACATDATADLCAPFALNSNASQAVEELTLPADSEVMAFLTERLRGAQNPRWFGLRRILSSEAYELLDTSGACVAQNVAPGWAAEVCPALAHHPCIVAWRGPVGEPPTAALTFGRRWV